jgi:hypothetical protein
MNLKETEIGNDCTGEGQQTGRPTEDVEIYKTFLRFTR